MENIELSYIHANLNDMKKNLKLLVAAHKADAKTRTDGCYLPVQAGKELHPELDLGFQNDNEGDNISSRNPSWCELTVLYWGWKNLEGVKYIGLNHYRRYFDGVDENNINSLMNGYDMIVAKQANPMLSRRERPQNLMVLTSLEDYYLFADTFLSIYPQYKREFIKYFYNSRVSYPYQMFIASKKIYDDYCSFMFPVLFEFEKRMKPHGYTRQKRTIGYLGEFFLALYVECKHLKVREMPIIDYSFSSNSLKDIIKRRILYRLRRSFASLLDHLYKIPKDIIVPSAVSVGFRSDGIELRALKAEV